MSRTSMLIAPAILFGAGLMLPGCTSCSLNGGWERQMNPFCVESRPDRPLAPGIRPPVTAPGLVKALPIVSPRAEADRKIKPAALLQFTERPARDDEKSRSLPLAQDEQNASCTSDRAWCVSLVQSWDDGQEVIAPLVYAADAAAPAAHPSPEDAFSNETYAVWPHLVLLADGGFLAGTELHTSTGYSGGGGSATELHLFRVSPEGKAQGRPVWRGVIDASLLIRACFGENDQERRLGACHDEYGFSGQVALGSEAPGRPPDLTYVTNAWAYPRGASREEDSTERARLEQSDLVREQDPECSFSRQFRFQPETRAYEPETPLPECSAYTVP